MRALLGQALRAGGSGRKVVMSMERLMGLLKACEDPVVRAFWEGLVREAYLG